jgi:hypothetical protein
MDKYGPLSEIARYGLNLVAVAWAIRIAVFGKAFWEPKVTDFKRAPVRIAGAYSAILIAVVFAVSRQQHDLYYWIPWIIACGGAIIVFFLVDMFLREWLIVRCSPRGEGVFGGIWLTPRARDIVLGSKAAYERGDLASNQSPPGSAKRLFCSFPVNNRQEHREEIWPSHSIAASQVLVVGNYIIWNILATVGLSIAATLVSIAMSQ